MKITLAMVTSLNGKITKDDDPHIYSWTSTADQEHFNELKSAADTIVMGRQTYEAAKSMITLQPGILRVVITTEPDSYQTQVVAGQLEFSDEAPNILIQRLGALGKTKVLLVGGSMINTLFFQAGLVDEVILTIEPRLFGTGKNLLSDIPLEANLRLQDIKQLNDEGTLALTYRVLR